MRGAHAGKRKGHQRRVARGQDHPRTCGEKKKCFITTTSRSGSPPHMRGKVPEYLGGDRIMRITPAHAGKRLSQYRARTLTRDHPRTCGEKNIVRKASFDPQGSPPHMRGKAPLYISSLVLDGITPAHAGKRLKRSRSTVPHAAIVPLFPSVCNKPAGSDGSPAGHDAPPFLPIENAAPASPAYNLRSL